MIDLFEEKNIAPMLLYQVEPFDDEDYIFELKLDGIRCIAYLDNDKVVLRNKRNKDVTLTYPELKEIFKCAKKRCILDGELVSLDKNGKPDFFALQKRSLMTDQLRIDLSAKRNPVQFVAYDILYIDHCQITDMPLMDRKKELSKNIAEGYGLSISRYIEKEGRAFFELAKSQDLEGVVAKKKEGLYYIGKRTREWVKIKVMQDEDLIVCGYKTNDNGGIKDLILGIYDDSVLIARGSVSLGISKEDEKTILEYAQKNSVNRSWFPKKQNVHWLKLGLVGTAHYMHQTENGHMRQPVWKGLRDDKTPKDCHVNSKMANLTPKWQI